MCTVIPASDNLWNTLPSTKRCFVHVLVWIIIVRIIISSIHVIIIRVSSSCDSITRQRSLTQTASAKLKQPTRRGKCGPLYITVIHRNPPAALTTIYLAKKNTSLVKREKICSRLDIGSSSNNATHDNINETINEKLSTFHNCLKANKLSLNVNKTSTPREIQKV